MLRLLLAAVVLLLIAPSAAAAASDRRCPAGTVDVARRDARIACAVVRSGNRRVVGRVVLADARGRVRRRFTVLDVPLRTGAPGTDIDVELLAGGFLAWNAGGRIVAVPPGGRPRKIGTGPFPLAVEDGRTLRWPSALGGYRYADLTPLRRDSEGCPRRARFRPGPVTGEHRVSVATYPGGDEEVSVTRVCLLGSGTDPAIGLDERLIGFGPLRQIVELTGPWALVTGVYADRYRQCARGEVRVVDLRSGAIARRAGSRDVECRDLPSRERPVVITPGGSPAWLDRRIDQERLTTLTSEGTLVELEAGQPRRITDLAAAGEAFGWRSGGEPRSAPAR